MADASERARQLSRQELYELVWSKPILELAKSFGLSDVALAKRCRRLAIPVPGRGYWPRVTAGQKPFRPSLPKREKQWGDEDALTVHPQTVEGNDADQASAAGAKAFRDRVTALLIQPAASVVDCVPAVKRTARHHRHARKAELTFERGERTGPIVSMDVTDGTLDRACLLADRILKTCEALGWSFVVPTPKDEEKAQSQRHGETEPARVEHVPLGQILIEAECVGLHIEERLREELRTPTAAELAREKREYGYRAPRKEYLPTGNLRVMRLDTYRTYGAPPRFTVYDRGTKRVEDQIPDILQGIQELALSIKLRRAEDERKAREYEEAQRRRQAFEARQEANAALIKQLETDAGAWHRARYCDATFVRSGPLLEWTAPFLSGSMIKSSTI